PLEYRYHPHPHSFPTRRSSDLERAAGDAAGPPAAGEPTDADVAALDPAALEGLAALPGSRDSQLVRRVIALFVETSCPLGELIRDRKSTRLNSSHQINSYAVFC